jgi:pullulanase
MRAFIDDFQLIRVESYDYIYQISILDHQVNWVKNDGFNQFFALDKPINFQMNDKIWINDQPYPLEIGVVTLTKAFEHKYRYDGKLGVIYHPDHTIFRIFSPVASEIILVLGDDEYVMNYFEPIWEIDVYGDQKNKPYYYKVRLTDTYKDVKDPYTLASTTNHSVVIDFMDTFDLAPNTN